MASHDEDHVYQPKDAVTAGVNTTMIMSGAGLTFSAIQTALTRQNVSAWAVFSRTGYLITQFGIDALIENLSSTTRLTYIIAVMGAAYGFSKTAAANLREKEDSYNPAIAGFLAGSAGALRCEQPSPKDKASACLHPHSEEFP